MKVNLAKALKVKNRLAGELTRLRAVFRRENSRRNDNPSKVDRNEVWVSIEKTVGKLIETKSQITRANIDIYPALAELEEVKSEIAFLQTLPVKEGVEKTSIGYSKEVVEYQWDAYLNQSRVDDAIKHLQTRADNLQDKIDSYNASHSVEIPD